MEKQTLAEGIVPTARACFVVVLEFMYKGDLKSNRVLKIVLHWIVLSYAPRLR